MSTLKTGKEDREFLKMSIREYRSVGEALMQGLFINGHGDLFCIKKLKNKKLRNYINLIVNSGYDKQSGLYSEATRLMKLEAKKRNLKGIQ